MSVTSQRGVSGGLHESWLLSTPGFLKHSASSLCSCPEILSSSYGQPYHVPGFIVVADVSSSHWHRGQIGWIFVPLEPT